MADISQLIKAKFLESTYRSAAFLLTRFPYASAILLMLATAESFKTNLSVEKNKLTLSHIHLGLFFISATAMSFDLFKMKRLFALVTAAQYIALSVEEYMDKNRKETLMVRQISRNGAIVGCYLLVAGGLACFERGAERNKRLLQTGVQLLGVYSFIYAAIMWNSATELKAHITHIPGGIFITYVFLALFIVTGICIYGGYEVFYFSKVLAWLLFVVTLFVDVDTQWWWKTSHIPKWVAMTVASKHGCVIVTLLLIRGNIK